MRITTFRRGLLLGGVLATLASGAAAQGVPRDEHPLPPGSDITSQQVPLAAPTGKDDRVAGFEEMQKARDAFNELLRAYESGNTAFIQAHLDPAMVGYQVFLDGLRRDINSFKNRRINLTDTQVTAGPDVAVIQTAWEKRFLSVGDFKPGLHTGRSMILLHRDGDNWRLVAVARDNLFASASGTLARFTIMPAVIPFGAFDGAVPLAIEIVDPDMTGLASVTLALSGSDGDRELLAVPAVAPGTFRLLSIDATSPVVAIPNDGILQLRAPGSFTVTYIDTNPGENRPPSTLTRILAVP